MKISKLFHWLYAFVMFLPVFFIGVRCGYVMLNKNAKDSYSEVSSISYTNAVGTTSVSGITYEVRYNSNGTVNSYQYLNVLNGKTNVNELYLPVTLQNKGTSFN